MNIINMWYLWNVKFPEQIQAMFINMGVYWVLTRWLYPMQYCSVFNVICQFIFWEVQECKYKSVCMSLRDWSEFLLERWWDLSNVLEKKGLLDSAGSCGVCQSFCGSRWKHFTGEERDSQTFLLQQVRLVKRVWNSSELLLGMVWQRSN